MSKITIKRILSVYEQRMLSIYSFFVSWTIPENFENYWHLWNGLAYHKSRVLLNAIIRWSPETVFLVMCDPSMDEL